MTLYIGVDPGKTGAVAELDQDYGPRVWDANDYVLRDEFRPGMQCVTALVERPDGRPGKGVSAFTFDAGRWAGRFEVMPRTTVIVISATVWTNAMGVGRDKGESLELARKLFPELAPMLQRKKDHNRAQALLIAEYGRRNQL